MHHPVSNGSGTVLVSSPSSNSAAAVSSSNGVDSFESYWNKYGNGISSNPYDLISRIENFFSGNVSSAKQKYETYLTDLEYQRNKQAKEAENKWTAEREDSQVQRAVKDIEAAGLNPWLALNGGSMSSAMVSSQSASARYKAKSDMLKNDKSGKGSSLLGTALKIMAILALKG